jgi:hypothetical protein
VYAHPQLATDTALCHHTQREILLASPSIRRSFPSRAPLPTRGSLTPAGAGSIYSRWLHRLQIPQRFSPPDGSIADLWIAQRLFRGRVPADQIRAALQIGSPGFPRRHSDPEDYLRGTLRRAAQQASTPFPARRSQSGPQL